ncbi:hypothetical protein NE237_001268 [Protea cynaroides]|uniref:Uncharacterized protein n=1 Tax=Protea cynaroides TaxID=273540 RepID=A0A9Q0KSS5_9MAGN|nr:hypothetical protein NE237_001268 [Protea cynaroides]
MFLGNGNSDQKPKANEIQDGEIVDADPMIKESLESNPVLQRDQPKEGNLQETRSSMMGPHLSINFINERSNWNLSGNRLPFKEIVDHEPFNASPDEQQDIDSESSDVTVED